MLHCFCRPLQHRDVSTSEKLNNAQQGINGKVTLSYGKICTLEHTYNTIIPMKSDLSNTFNSVIIVRMKHIMALLSYIFQRSSSLRKHHRASHFVLHYL